MTATEIEEVLAAFAGDDPPAGSVAARYLAGEPEALVAVADLQDRAAGLLTDPGVHAAVEALLRPAEKKLAAVRKKYPALFDPPPLPAGPVDRTQVFAALVDYFRKEYPADRPPRHYSSAESLAASVFSSFHSGVTSGRYPDLDDEDDLWGLLIRIAERKVGGPGGRKVALSPQFVTGLHAVCVRLFTEAAEDDLERQVAELKLRRLPDADIARRLHEPENVVRLTVAALTTKLKTWLAA